MSDIDRIGEELRKRVLQDGIIFLEQEGKLNGILADMFPELKKERRWVRMAMESGIGKTFSRIASCTDENEKQNLLLRSFEIKLVSLLFLSKFSNSL